MKIVLLIAIGIFAFLIGTFLLFIYNEYEDSIGGVIAYISSLILYGISFMILGILIILGTCNLFQWIIEWITN